MPGTRASNPTMDGERGVVIAIATLAVAAVAMLGEDRRSRRHERVLRARGGTEAPGDVYRLMQVAYPACFVAMTIEGIASGIAAQPSWTAGAALFLAAKGFKYWAIASLGDRWTFRVLVPPGEPLVRRGPYRWLAHPNYLAVVGELAGMAIMMAAPLAGTLAVVGFGALMTRRIAVENRALGL